VMPGRFDEANQTAGRTAVGSNGGSVPTSYSPWVAAPFFPGYVTTHTAAEAYRRVLSDVGANQPLDDHDARVIAETRTGTTTYSGSASGYPGLPDSQSDVGGWEDYGSEVRSPDFDTDHDGLPDVWEVALGLDALAQNHNADPDGDGYTQLEDYLHFLAGAHAITTMGSAVEFDLRTLARGLSGAVSYSVSAPTGGTIALLADGFTARFTPAAGFTGVGRFGFTASDGTPIGGSVAVLVAVPMHALHSVQMSAGLFSVALHTVADHDYQLQTSPTLAPAAWSDVGMVRAGTGSTVIFTHTPPVASQRFYRVRLVR
jgi:hypothetical protein